MTIMQKRDRFRADDCSPSSRAVNQLSNGWGREIFSAAKFVGFSDDGGLCVLKGLPRVDSWPEFAIGQKSVAVRVNPGGEGGAVNVGRSRVNGVMLPEGHAFLGKLPKRGGVALGYEVRAHAVPDDDHHVSVF